MESILEIVSLLVYRMAETGKVDPRVLALAIECYQLYIDYLDDLETAIHIEPQSIVVKVQDQTIKFKDTGDTASWITSL